MSTHHASDRFLDHAGARLRWRQEGSGPPIVLLHGWALDLDAWNPVASQLASHFTVLRFDRRGFGLSSGQPDIHCNVTDLAALLRHAGIPRAILAGMSQGARLALHFALEHPSPCRALILDGAPALEAESELPLDQYRTTLEARGRTALQSEILQHPLMQLQTADPVKRQLLAQIVARYAGQDLLQSTKRRRPLDLAAISQPVLILNGSADLAERRLAGHQLQETLRSAQRVELPGCGHLALLDDPIRYAATVATFCQGLPP